MLNKLQKIRAEKSNNKGFTIIEVMIVLAIAGLIILIVFLAVPALQRSSRNTQRKSDVGRLGSGATTVVNNANGSLSALTTASLNAEVGTYGYYTATNVSVAAVGASGTTNPGKVDKVLVVTGAKCNGSNAVAGSGRQTAILYTLEPAVKVCVDQ